MYRSIPKRIELLSLEGQACQQLESSRSTNSAGVLEIGHTLYLLCRRHLFEHRLLIVSSIFRHSLQFGVWTFH